MGLKNPCCTPTQIAKLGFNCLNSLSVWRDGTFTEFQNSWNEQPVVPGYVAGGGDKDYDKEIGGISCYECVNCPVEPFQPERDGTAIDTNCYVCSKEWDEGWFICY